jgi:CIC family chloride channel protein
LQDNNDQNQKSDPLISSRSIRRLLERRWFVVVLALSLTGLGATITGLLFQSGIHVLSDWRRDLLHEVPAWIVLPVLGTFGGFVSGWLISNFAPAAAGAGVTHIMGFLRHKSVPMGLRVGLVKLVAGIIAIGCGFPLGPEGPAVQMGGSVAWQMSRWLKAPIAFRRVIVAAGGGAGIAAVFSAPLGGFIYAIEELLHSARPVVLLLVLITTFSADTWADVLGVFGLGSGAKGFQPNLGFLLERKFPIDVEFFPIDVIYLISLGALIGVLAELYTRYVLMMQRQGQHWFGNRLILRMSLSGLVLGSVYAALPSSFHNLDELFHMIGSSETGVSQALAGFVGAVFQHWSGSGFRRTGRAVYAHAHPWRSHGLGLWRLGPIPHRPSSQYLRFRRYGRFRSGLFTHTHHCNVPGLCIGERPTDPETNPGGLPHQFSDRPTLQPSFHI